jgi:shikimate kinase
MTTGIVRLIGGASASGKSTTAKEIARTLGVPLIELDPIYNAVEKGGSSGAVQTTNDICETLLAGLLSASADCVLEGGWISPEIAQKHCGDGMIAVFTGYPGADASERLEVMRQSSKHWISRLDDSEAIEKIEQQIVGSRWYRDEAAKRGFTFIDFSSFEEGASALKATLLNSEST